MDGGVRFTEVMTEELSEMEEVRRSYTSLTSSFLPPLIHVEDYEGHH
jgi:hypothetical protein